MAEESEKHTIEGPEPVILNLGKQKRGAIKKLKKGEGKLWDEVLDAVSEVKKTLGKEAEDKVLVPVVMLYRKKSRRRSISLDKIFLPYLGGKKKR